jgi:hypothetical protein
MQLTKEQLESVRNGNPLRLNEDGTALVILRADVFERFEDALQDGAPDDADWQRWFEKIETCRTLKDGWNSYTAPAPNDKSLANAHLFLQVMQLEGIEPTRVGPSAMGGIAITRRVGSRKVFVEFYNDGRVYSLFSEKAAEMKVFPLDADSLSFHAFIQCSSFRVT